MSEHVVFIGRAFGYSDVFMKGSFLLDCKEDRREVLHDAVSEALEEGSLDPGSAGKLGAKAHFASTTLAGKCLRGCENALAAQQYGRWPRSLCDPAGNALMFLRLALKVLPGKRVLVGPWPGSHAVCYDDAMWEPQAPTGMAFLISCGRCAPERATPWCHQTS